MAAGPGEDIAVTLFADVHYFYGPPTAKPPHHRFEKASYVYLYENHSQRRGRIEIANNAGTADQDAFCGFLDNSHIEYSYKHPTLMTLTVDGSSAVLPDTDQWHMPAFDPQNDKVYLYKLHTIDIYFWTKEDALSFVDATKRLLPTSQLQILDDPSVPHSHTAEMSPLVQNLENVAISDPLYQDGQSRNSQNTTQIPGPPANAFPGPPTMEFPGPPKSVSPAQRESASIAPMAYNPAAPAAPEVIRHREKTPPPDDGDANPLAAAAVSDQGQQFIPGIPQQSSGPPPSAPPYAANGFLPGSYFPGPPQAGIKSPYGPGSVPSAPKSSSNSSQQSNIGGQYAGFLPQYTLHPQYATHPGSPGFPPSMQSPPLSPQQSFSQVPPPPSAAPSAPVGGYSSYSYNQSNNVPGANDYAVHQQIYRPTEGEAAIKAHKIPREPRGKLEDRAAKLEKGVTGFLKKFEKKYG